MTFAHVGTHQTPTEANPFSLVTHNAGDIVPLVLITTGTAQVTGVAGGGCTWAQQVAPVSMPAVSGYGCGWLGTVTAAGTANVTLTFGAGTATVIRPFVDEFSTTAGAANVSLDAYATLNGDTNTWPTLTPSGSGRLYWGGCKNDSEASAGSTPGFTYEVDANFNGAAYDLSVPAATGPVWNDSTQAAGVMMLFKEASAAPAASALLLAALPPAALVRANVY